VTFYPLQRQGLRGIFGVMGTESEYLTAWGEVLLFLVAGLLFIFSALLVSRLIRPRRPNAEKLTAYESGEEPVGLAWVQFNIRFYVIALIFLLFEVEIVFLFPWATVFADAGLIHQTQGAWGWFALAEMIIFVAILAIGLVYVWVHGYLDWMKPSHQPTEYKSPVPKELYENLNERYRRKQGES
jgi:NADH-quinone oxidoreductase subunit A